jgi:AcrR family transcriptional regulator
MISREKLIEAAARVYAAAGFRGATTRRIADEAGVNEITIFRLFGSKAALIEEALRSRGASARGDGAPHASALPRVPVDPEREVGAWAAGALSHLRRDRVLIRKTLAELEERPEIAPTLCGGMCDAEVELREYARRLRRAGRLSDPAGDACGIKVDLDVAVAMFTSALFADAMGRDVMPEMYPQPAERAPVLYTRCFLRSIGLRRAASGTLASGAAGTPGARPARKAAAKTEARKVAARKVAARETAARTHAGSTRSTRSTRRTSTRTHQ